MTLLQDPAAAGAAAGDIPAVLTSATRLLWDFDGVVCDTEPAHHASFQEMLIAGGAELQPGWFEVGVSEPDRWAGWVAQFGDGSRFAGRTAAELLLDRGEVFDRHAHALIPNWYVHRLLELPVEHVVISAGNHTQIMGMLVRWGLEAAFARVLAVGSPGVPAGQAKTDRVAANAVPGAVVLEDTVKYIDFAHSLGLDTVSVQHGFNDVSDTSSRVHVNAHLPGSWTQV